MDLQMMARSARTAAGRRRTSGAAGFSLLEMMVAAALLLFIALGLIPLFARAIRDNATGSDFTQATNGSKSRLEEAQQLPFNSRTLEVANGQMVGEVVEAWAQGDPERIGDSYEGWVPPASSGVGLLTWERRTRTQQYSMGDLDKQRGDYTLTPDEREIGGTDPTFVHLKEVEVVLESEKASSMFGGGKTVTLRVLKPF